VFDWTVGLRPSIVGMRAWFIALVLSVVVVRHVEHADQGCDSGRGRLRRRRDS